MSILIHSHRHVPNGVSKASASVNENIRPCFRLAYLLPLTDADERFRQVLQAPAEVGRRQFDQDAPEGL